MTCSHCTCCRDVYLIPAPCTYADSKCLYCQDQTSVFTVCYRLMHFLFQCYMGWYCTRCTLNNNNNNNIRHIVRIYIYICYCTSSALWLHKSCLQISQVMKLIITRLINLCILAYLCWYCNLCTNLQTYSFIPCIQFSILVVLHCLDAYYACAFHVKHSAHTSVVPSVS